jgi:hypothetical protein
MYLCPQVAVFNAARDKPDSSVEEIHKNIQIFPKLFPQGTVTSNNSGLNVTK